MLLDRYVAISVAFLFVKVYVSGFCYHCKEVLLITRHVIGFLSTDTVEWQKQA